MYQYVEHQLVFEFLKSVEYFFCKMGFSILSNFGCRVANNKKHGWRSAIHPAWPTGRMEAHRWVPVNTHGTPVPFGGGRGWPESKKQGKTN